MAVPSKKSSRRSQVSFFRFVLKATEMRMEMPNIFEAAQHRLEESRRGLEESRRQTRAYDEETSRIQAETRAKKLLIAQIEEQIEELKEQKARRDAQLAQCESTRNEEME